PAGAAASQPGTGPGSRAGPPAGPRPSVTKTALTGGPPPASGWELEVFLVTSPDLVHPGRTLPILNLVAAGTFALPGVVRQPGRLICVSGDFQLMSVRADGLFSTDA